MLIQAPTMTSAHGVPSVNNLTTIPDSTELLEAVRILATALSGSLADTMDPGRVQYMARKALSAADLAAWRIREQSTRIAALERDAVTDPLTSLLNRRGFETEMRRTLADIKRYGEGGALLYIDLDGFKQTNDTHGHACGDAVLQKVAAVLRDGVRDTDRVARLGGDEFAVLLTRTSLENATLRAKALEWSLNHAAVAWDDGTIAIRASLGSEPFGEHDNQSDIIERADAAMYRAKQQKPRSVRYA